MEKKGSGKEFERQGRQTKKVRSHCFLRSEDALKKHPPPLLESAMLRKEGYRKGERRPQASWLYSAERGVAERGQPVEVLATKKGEKI